jgi:hypothetical protein
MRCIFVEREFEVVQRVDVFLAVGVALEKRGCRDERRKYLTRLGEEKWIEARCLC